MPRYGAAEQALVIAHEQVHSARRDALANLLQAAFQCVRGAQEAGRVWVVSKVYRDAKVVGTPNLLAHLNEKIGVKVGDSDDPSALSMVVTQQP